MWPNLEILVPSATINSKNINKNKINTLDRTILSTDLDNLYCDCWTATNYQYEIAYTISFKCRLMPEHETYYIGTKIRTNLRSTITRRRNIFSNQKYSWNQFDDIDFGSVKTLFKTICDVIWKTCMRHLIRKYQLDACPGNATKVCSLRKSKCLSKM